jgi:pyocin large subunit-like protein
MRLASVTGLNEKTVRRSLEHLRAVGLIERVFHGKSAGRRGLADEHRLVIPADLVQRVEMLAPDEVSPGTRP